MLFQGFDEVVCIVQTFIFETKIIHDKGEGDGESGMCPYDQSCFALTVAMGLQYLGKEMIGKDSSLWQSVNDLLHFNVDVAIGYQMEKIVLGDDLEGDNFDGDA
jgi:hypothetical protein